MYLQGKLVQKLCLMENYCSLVDVGIYDFELLENLCQIYDSVEVSCVLFSHTVDISFLACRNFDLYRGLFQNLY